MKLPSGEQFDVAVIGGGIQGAGAAQAAAAAGYHTLLIERDEWASATSRWSSKLIHGGLRYLESAQFNLVYHALQERQRLFRNAPALVKPVKFFIPIYRDTHRRPWQIRAGLSLYALFTGFNSQAFFRSLPRSEWSSLGGIRQDDLQAVFQYWDGQTDDTALTHAVVRSAQQLQTIALEHSELLSAKQSHDDFELTIKTHATEWQCTARAVINATGPWVNALLERCSPAPTARALSYVKGTHIVLPPHNLPGIFYIEAPRDGRAVFVMPWQGKTLVGTTEMEINTPTAAPSPTEIDYLIETVRAYFPDVDCTIMDSFAGVRVLPAGTGRAFSRARESIIATFDADGAPLISIYGGKLTTYRHTAEQVIALLRSRIGVKKAVADTRTLPLI
ncbi:MAG TPA: FAD-dependent oxidoreductase [Spongiibacteraceae bacterium]|nr:FAD-dependent oxidoreductase [Spongiibacteraceae bacterium]